MIDELEAIAIATEYFKETNEEILDGKESADSWIFSGGVRGQRKFGDCAIEIDKETGTVHSFHLPNKENLKKIKESRTIDAIKREE